ncbi:class I SAM-dependent methyltransferase [bacterium]|nr:class I SAM-dependent methyltransferase [bacterium]
MVSDSKSDVSEYFDGFENYDIYYKGAWKHYRRKFVDLVRKNYNGAKDIRLLDLGCGRISSLPELLSEPNIFLYHCVDSSSESLRMLKALSSSNKKIKISESDIIDFVSRCNEKYDIIILFGVVMYLTRPNAKKLFRGLDRLVNDRGMILLHEPNQRGDGTLDEHSQVLANDFLKDLVSSMDGISIKNRRNYNITWLRRPVVFVFGRIKRVFEKRGVKGKFLIRFIERIENSAWYIVVLLEALLSKMSLGCDSLIAIEKETKAK